MIGNIATVFAGGEANPTKFAHQRMERSIRRCIQNHVSDAVQLVLLALAPPAMGLSSKQQVSAPNVDANVDATVDATADVTTNAVTDATPLMPLPPTPQQTMVIQMTG